MVQIKQGNIFGRIGEGLGKGIGEQLPEEIQRGRLASGLQDLSQQQGLSPFQQFSGLSSLPGVTPQMIQSGSELLRQQARGQALADFQNQKNRPQPSPFPPRQTAAEPASNIPSITQQTPLEKIQEGYIPPTIEERDAIAGDAYNANPAFFGNDPQKAIDWANTKIAQEEKIAQAYQTKHGNLNAIQDNVVKRLNDQSKKLETNIPAELYSRIEDEAIQATKSKKEGGRGLTEQQAMKEYGDKLNDASRDFAKIGEIGNWEITQRPAQTTLRSIKALQNKMEELGETDNFAKKLISESKLSPQMAYGQAEPVNRVPALNGLIKSLPELSRPHAGGLKVKPSSAPKKTLEIAPRLAKIVSENPKASPLAIAYELDKKGYDAETWLQYVTDHARDLDLRQRQAEQAATPINLIAPWNDWWLSAFSGLE